MLKNPLCAVREPEPYRFTVEEWHKLGEAGIFAEDDRVELLDGEIILMSPIGSRHAAAMANLTEVMVEKSRRRYLVAPGNPVEADRHSEPVPDLMLLPRSCHNARRHPLTKDIHLIIEIADSSLGHDRRRKLKKYARTGAPEYWIVNLRQDVIEVYRGPHEDTYLEQLTFAAGQKVNPQAFPDVEVAVDEIIPPR
ncbi:MAG: Uma2 family endonuclease [Verrucomicrobiota bacterium]|nr:Uma2 family endonuclease [Verrucomicrobiota bacterium]